MEKFQSALAAAVGAREILDASPVQHSEQDAV
jgi:hypothetical protein